MTRAAACFTLGLLGCLAWTSVAAATTTDLMINAKTGALTSIPYPPSDPGCDVPFPPDGQDWPNSGDDPEDASAVAPNGKFLYSTSSIANAVVMCAIDSKTGRLSSLGTVATGDFPDGIVITPNGKDAYVSNGYGHSVSMYAVNSKTGVLVAAATPELSLGNSPGVVITHDSKHAYVNDGPTATTYAIDQKTGTLTPTAAPAFNAQVLTVSPSGKVAYAATIDVSDPQDTTYSVSPYTINAKTGTLSAVAGVSPITIHDYDPNLTLSPNGKYAYIYGASTDPTLDYRDVIYMYAVNPKTGALSPLAAPPVEAEHGDYDHTDALAITPNGKYLYTTNYYCCGASAFAVNTKTGTLSPLNNSEPFDVGEDPMGFAITPNGKYAYVPFASGGLS